jgi:hypothetical protein
LFQSGEAEAPTTAEAKAALKLVNSYMTGESLLLHKMSTLSKPGTTDRVTVVLSTLLIKSPRLQWC